MAEPSATRPPPEVVKPPWDEWAIWDEPELGPDVWAEHFAGLASWVAWLQEAYRFVRLPPCWADHEGLRIELGAFWCQWISLHAPVNASQLQAAAGALVGWHDYLRRAAHDWQERYGACEHISIHVDQVGRDRHEFHQQSAPFLRCAFEHERGARERWPDWSPLSMEASDSQPAAEGD
jgi:hypothetical protein